MCFGRFSTIWPIAKTVDLASSRRVALPFFFFHFNVIKGRRRRPSRRPAAAAAVTNWRNTCWHQLCHVAPTWRMSYMRHGLELTRHFERL